MADQPKPRHRALAGGGRMTAYDAADYGGEHMEAWRPALWSQDIALNPFRDTIVARARDLARNDGWASGAVTRLLDNAIGASFRPIAKPDHRALAAYTANSRFDPIWAEEYARWANGVYRSWAHDETGKWCDASRRFLMSTIYGVGFRHLLIDNDAVAIMGWKPDRIAPGMARYATCVRLMNPDQLSNPQNRFDTEEIRGGCQVDGEDVTVGYHFRKAHIGDWWAGPDTVTWEYVPRETAWGRPMVVHHFEPTQAGQHRGGDGIFTAVLERARMLFKYDKAELDAALINAIFAAIAESPFDHELMAEALGEGDATSVNAYQNGRADFHQDRKIEVGGVRVTQMYPGEKLEFLQPQRPNPNFGIFEKAVLRNMAMAVGSGASQVSGDYSDVNFSSLRAEINEIWKTVTRRRANFGSYFANPIRICLLEEAHDLDDPPMPKGGEVPDFIEFRQAFGRAAWLGPGKGWVDPVAEKQGAVLGMDAGLSTLEHEAAEHAGEDFEDILDQRAIEVRAFKDRGLEVPTWANMNAAPPAANGTPASNGAKKPEAA
ncbi:MAG: phage portal protein [Proteobacteria bacterium]|nr:phage portal protein [Pseudomonadota bacterium]